MTIDRRNHEPLGRVSELGLPPLQYYEVVMQMNILLQKELAVQLEKAADKLDVAVAIATPGSDGRLEAGSLASPYEALILTNAEVDLVSFEATVKQLIEECAPGRIANFEVKGPHSSLAAYKDNAHNLQPARVAEMRKLAGNQQIFVEAKERLGQEVINMSGDQVKRVAELRRSARRPTTEGKNRIGGTDAVHFDLETGTVFFNPEAHQLSFKVGPLRLVQTSLLIEEVKHTRSQKDPGFMRTLHSGIVNRLGRLSDDRLLNLGRDAVRELQEHYAFFLQLYHQSEQAFVRDHAVARQLSPSEVDEVARRLVALRELADRLKIQKQPG